MADVDPKALEALKDFQAEWDALEAAPDYEDIESGDYRCRFDSSKSRLHVAETGRPGYRVVFVIIDGDYEDRTLYVDLWFKSELPMVKRMAKRDLLKLGLTASDLPNPPAVNGNFLVTVKANDKGYKVQKFEPIV